MDKLSAKHHISDLINAFIFGHKWLTFSFRKKLFSF